MKNQLAYLFLGLKDFIDPLRKSVSDLDALEYLFYRYGWDVPMDGPAFDLVEQFSDIKDGLEQFLQKAEAIQAKISAEESDLPYSEMLPLITSATTLVKSIAAFSASQQDILPAPLDQGDFWEDVGEQLLDDLLETYLRVYQPIAYALLHLWGVIKYDKIDLKEPYRIAYVRKTIDWEQGLAMLKNPFDALKQEYHWGDPENDFENDRFLFALEKALRSVKVLAQVGASGGESGYDGITINYDCDAVRITLLNKISWIDLISYEVGIALLPIIRNGPKPNTGLMIEPILRGGLGQQFSLSDDFKIQWQAGLDLSDVFAVALFPDKADLVSGEAAFSTSLKFFSDRSTPFYLLGNETTSRVEISNLSAELSVAGTIDDVEIKLQMTSTGDDINAGCRILVLLDEADAFVEKTTDASGFEFSFSPELIFSNKTGFSFNGTPDFKVFLPISKKIGPVTLQNPTIEFVEGEKKTSRSSMALRVGVGIKGDFGPVSFVIEQMGFACNIIPYTRQDIAALPPGTDGPALGNLGLDLKFAPPRGIGIEIKATAVTGGGYLYMDHDRGEYIGVAQLNIKDKINVKAIGVILTKLPDGKKGYSFLLMITAEFQPIQIGLGFMLAGVGGLVGIHRGLDHEKLFTGLRENTMDDILFPANPLDNPYGLVNKINTVFPVAQGQYTFGLLGLFYWGAKDLVTIKLGLIIELPVFRIAIMGVVKVEKSEPVEGGEEGETKSLIRIMVNFAGLFDFEKKFIRFDASLYDSHIMGLKLEGDMALRIRYGQNPDFLLTVGGFHPNFQPPELELPANLRRLSVTLYSGNPNILMECYMAITANTFQFGAAAYLTYESSGVSVRGELSFDALFQFSPFHFEVGLYFLMSASWKGEEFAAIEVTGLLSGPAPWHIYGKLRLEIWKFSIELDLDQTWGDKTDGQLSSVKVMPILIADLKTPGNWEAAPGNTHLSISTRTLAAADSKLTLHPNELLTVRQNTVPLGLKLDKFSEKKLVGPSKFRIELTGADGKPLESTPVKNHFAPAQFFQRSDEEKISASSYQLFESGAGFEGLDAIQLDAWRSIDIVYESKIIDDPALVQQPTIPGGKKETLADFAHGLGNNAVANSIIGARQGRNRSSTVIDEQFVVVLQDSLSVHENFAPTSEAEAQQLLKNFLRNNPRERGKLTVLPMSEVTV